MNKNFENEILYNIKKVTGNKPIQLHKPKFEGNEIKYLKQCIETTLVSSVGPFVKNLKKNYVSILVLSMQYQWSMELVLYNSL